MRVNVKFKKIRNKKIGGWFFEPTSRKYPTIIVDNTMDMHDQIRLIVHELVHYVHWLLESGKINGKIASGVDCDAPVTQYVKYSLKKEELLCERIAQFAKEEFLEYISGQGRYGKKRKKRVNV